MSEKFNNVESYTESRTFENSLEVTEPQTVSIQTFSFKIKSLEECRRDEKNFVGT